MDGGFGGYTAASWAFQVAHTAFSLAPSQQQIHQPRANPFNHQHDYPPPVRVSSPSGQGYAVPYVPAEASPLVELPATYRSQYGVRCGASVPYGDGGDAVYDPSWQGFYCGYEDAPDAYAYGHSDLSTAASSTSSAHSGSRAAGTGGGGSSYQPALPRPQTDYSARTGGGGGGGAAATAPSAHLGRVKESVLVSRQAVEQLSRSAPVWVVYYNLSLNGPTGQPGILTADQLVQAYCSRRVQGHTLLVGLSAGAGDVVSARKEAQGQGQGPLVPPAFLRPLVFVLAQARASVSYKPISREQLEAGLPPAGWCLPGSLFQPTVAAAATSPWDGHGALARWDASAVDSAVRALLARAPYWCLLSVYADTGRWTCPQNLSSGQVLERLRSGHACLHACLLGTCERLPVGLWIPTSMVLPLAALLQALGSDPGLEYTPPCAVDVKFFIEDAVRAVRGRPEAEARLTAHLQALPPPPSPPPPRLDPSAAVFVPPSRVPASTSGAGPSRPAAPLPDGGPAAGAGAAPAAPAAAAIAPTTDDNATTGRRITETTELLTTSRDALNANTAATANWPEASPATSDGAKLGDGTLPGATGGPDGEQPRAWRQQQQQEAAGRREAARDTQAPEVGLDRQHPQQWSSRGGQGGASATVPQADLNATAAAAPQPHKPTYAQAAAGAAAIAATVAAAEAAEARAGSGGRGAIGQALLLQQLGPQPPLPQPPSYDPSSEWPPGPAPPSALLMIPPDVDGVHQRATGVLSDSEPPMPIPVPVPVAHPHPHANENENAQWVEAAAAGRQKPAHGSAPAPVAVPLSEEQKQHIRRQQQQEQPPQQWLQPQAHPGAVLVPIPTPFIRFETAVFRLFQGDHGQHTFSSLWWYLDPAATTAVQVLGPYSCEQMILAYIAQLLPGDALVCGTRGTLASTSAPPASAFLPLGALLEATEEGRPYALMQVDPGLPRGTVLASPHVVDHVQQPYAQDPAQQQQQPRQGVGAAAQRVPVVPVVLAAAAAARGASGVGGVPGPRLGGTQR